MWGSPPGCPLRRRPPSDPSSGTKVPLATRVDWDRTVLAARGSRLHRGPFPFDPSAFLLGSQSFRSEHNWMIIKSVTVENFRCVVFEVLTCENLAALVGANGSGKSSFLKALDLFYSTSPKLSAEDFYNGDTKKNIQITVTFCSLDDSEKQHFKKYLQKDELSVVRVLSLDEGKLSDKYHGSSLQCPDFVDVRRVGGATAMREAYSHLREKEEYKAIRKWKNKEDALAALAEWEDANQNACVREFDDGQFFGFRQVAQGYLGECTRYLYPRSQGGCRRCV